MCSLCQGSSCAAALSMSLQHDRQLVEKHTPHCWCACTFVCPARSERAGACRLLHMHVFSGQSQACCLSFRVFRCICQLAAASELSCAGKLVSQLEAANLAGFGILHADTMRLVLSLLLFELFCCCSFEVLSSAAAVAAVCMHVFRCQVCRCYNTGCIPCLLDYACCGGFSLNSGMHCNYC